MAAPSVPHKDNQPLAIHPDAERIPEETPEHFATLKAEIERDGLRVPIAICQGQILDGRHRYRACVELGIQPRFEYLPDDTDTLAYVIAMNVTRRHLTTSQRAISAALMVTTERGGQGANQYTAAVGPHGSIAMDRERSAALWKVGVRSVTRGLLILNHKDEDLIRRVRAGELTLSAAEKAVRGLAQPQQLSLHPLTQLFPDMPADHFERFKASIADIGMIHAITIHDGMILDGRLRYQAAFELGLESVPIVEKPADITPFKYVLAMNVKRGHLTDDQIALTAARLAAPDPKVEDTPESERIKKYLWAANVCRRHLSEDQRALMGASMIAAEDNPLQGVIEHE